MTAAHQVHLVDFDQAKAMFARWQGRFEQISCGKFEGHLRVVRGNLVRAVAIEANQRFLLRGRDEAGLLGVFPVIAGNAASQWQGRQLDEGRLVLTGVETEINHCSARRSGSLGIYLRPEMLEDAARSLLASDVPNAPRSWALRTPPPDAFARLKRELHHFLTLAPELLGTSEGDQVEQECLRRLVTAVFPAAAQPPRLSSAKRAQTIRQAEEFMRSRMNEPIGTVELCRELRISDRTLRLAFRNQYGVGPIVYHRYLRLNAVREQLKARPDRAIADIARTNGFHHLGNFAADYRRLFGLRPSQTPGRV